VTEQKESEVETSSTPSVISVFVSGLHGAPGRPLWPRIPGWIFSQIIQGENEFMVVDP